jgi:hypothetical protein
MYAGAGGRAFVLIRATFVCHVMPVHVSIVALLLFSLPSARRRDSRLAAMYGQGGGMGGMGGRPQDFERVARTVHVGGIGGLGETISENDVADFFGQQGARLRGRACCARRAGPRAQRGASTLLFCCVTRHATP